MSTDTALWKAIAQMPDALKAETLHYAEFLLAKYSNTHKTPEQPEKSHGYGSWAGQIVMSDDFDQPLDDLQDYM
ncbi:MAG: DUF2281 domain-containing protein [Leptolyngbyaceae cyanobacterium CAN_BIN12]|nr:DUF2281 domain-containing protein [Leptolyngbyaceae cyanobacterium CAN_BIN12]